MNNLFCNGYPYTDFHEMNLSWLVKKVMELNTRLTEFVSLNTIKYADPIQWSITTQYGTNTVVIDPVSGVAYLSVKPVPMGVSLSNDDYWTEIFDLGQIIGNINKNLTLHNDGYSTTSTFDLKKGDWVLWNGVLYTAIHDIDIGDAYVVDANIEAHSVEELVFSYVEDLEDKISDEAEARAEEDARIELELQDLIASEANVRASEDSRIELELQNLITSNVNIIQGEIGDLDDLTTNVKTDLVSAINEVNGGVKYCNDRSEVSGVNALENGYILSANAYQNDGIISLYKVTTGAADGYLNIAMDNDLTAELIHGNVIHAHQVGAFPDNNDCTNAIRYLLNIEPLTIKFGSGRYRFNNNFYLQHNQKIIGNGHDTILYCAQDPSDNRGGFICIDGQVEQDIKHDIVLKDFDIDIYYLESATEDVNPIGVVYCKNLTIENVNVLRSNWRGFQFEGGTNGVLENVVVRDCNIYNCYLNGIGLSHATTGSIKNILFENINIVNSNANGGIWIQGPNATDIHMDNIIFKNISYSGGTARALYILYAANIIVDGMTERDIIRDMYAVNSIQQSHNVKLNNFNVDCYADNTNNFGIMLYDAHEVIITNLSTTNATVGVQIQNDSDNVTVANSMINTRSGGTPIRNQVAALHGYISGCLYNNAISNASTDFIELS